MRGLAAKPRFLSESQRILPETVCITELFREVAELATRELPEERNAAGQNLNAVFFLEEDPNDRQGPLWVGPSSSDVFLQAIGRVESRFGHPAVHKGGRLADELSSRCPTRRRKNYLSGTFRSWGAHTLQSLALRFWCLGMSRCCWDS